MKLDERGFYDIYGMMHQPWWQRSEWRIFFCIVALVGVLFLVVIGMRFYLMRKKKKKLTSWQQALHDIQRITLPVPLTQEGGSAFYEKISKILKNYIHDQFLGDVLGKTDQEVIAWADRCCQRGAITPEVKEMITEVLSGGEYIKFAGYQALQETVDCHRAMSIAIIKKSMPQAMSEKSGPIK